MHARQRETNRGGHQDNTEGRGKESATAAANAIECRSCRSERRGDGPRASHRFLGRRDHRGAGQPQPPSRLQPASSPLVALDIGGTLIKLAYTASCRDGSNGTELRFATFDKHRLDDCFEFLRAEGLIRRKGKWSSNENVVLKATGGGAYNFSDKFQEELDVYLDKLYEFESIVSGANFLLENVPSATFTYINEKMSTIDVSPTNLVPYLIVNIGSGVSMIKVTGNRNFEFITGTQIGGAFVFGLAKLLTGCRSYEAFLQLCQNGDNSVLDLVVKDICREFVSQQQGISATTLTSSFGKVITSEKKLADYKSEDLASALLCAFTYNVAQIAFLVATLLGLRRVVFAGSFICEHKSTMENISYSIDAWSHTQMKAIFLRHEGHLGVIGALISYFDPIEKQLKSDESTKWIKPSLDDCLAPLHGTSANEKMDSDIFPYLFVNIGTVVSMMEVSGKGSFKTITGSHLGGGTILGLAKLLTGCSSYEEFWEQSQKGNNLSIDLTIKDTFGESCHKCGIPASFVVGSFGRVHSNELSEYKIEDISASLMNCFIHNIGQIVYLMTKILGLKRIFFHGAFVCGHEKVMDEISHFLEQRLKGEIQEMKTSGRFYMVLHTLGISNL
ncbi:hypothetical protein QOZ80_6BG0464800 [Eleusine coracana subsp. coracana]|nr:hypothetical protein QOZ80_6BG0464800 [Eleusine coracana subsp. coracana]